MAEAMPFPLRLCLWLEWEGLISSPPTLPQQTRKGWGTPGIRESDLRSDSVGHPPDPKGRKQFSGRRETSRLEFP